MSVCSLGQWAQSHRHRHRGLSDSRKSRLLGKDGAGQTWRVVSGDICLPDRSGRIQSGDHVRDAPEGGAVWEQTPRTAVPKGDQAAAARSCFLQNHPGAAPESDCFGHRYGPNTGCRGPGGRICVISRAFDCRYDRSRELSDYCNILGDTRLAMT